MATLEFRQGNMFDQESVKADVLAYIGRNNMSFGLGRSLIPTGENIFDPFTERPFELIPIGSNRYLCCIPGDFMSDEECSSIIERLFNMVSKKGLKSIAFNGVRNSNKSNVTDIDEAIQIDNNRVNFIVDKIIEWYNHNRTNTTINHILLIAMSDNFIRNYSHPITL